MIDIKDQAAIVFKQLLQICFICSDHRDSHNHDNKGWCENANGLLDMKNTSEVKDKLVVLRTEQIFHTERSVKIKT